MAETIIREITTGADGTQIKAGMISNDSGDGQSQTDLDTLQACALAHRSTGAPIFVNAGETDDEPHTVLEALNELGVDLEAVTFVHMGSHPRSVVKAIVESGCKVALDDFGQGIHPASDYSYSGSGNGNVERRNSSEESMLSTLEWLASEDRGDQILVSQNINSADRYTRHGGHGYFYLLANVVPRMRAMGFDENMIEQLFVSNPADALTFRSSSLSTT
jgi:phosphotriesterase-related protein